MARSRVLVVDDHPDVLTMLCILVEQLGYECRATGTGEGALQLATTFAPDVILLDIGLPDRSGYDVARALRAAGTSAKIIAVTGWGSREDIERSRAAGIDAHVMKPVSGAKIAELLRTSLTADAE